MNRNGNWISIGSVVTLRQIKDNAIAGFGRGGRTTSNKESGHAWYSMRPPDNWCEAAPIPIMGRFAAGIGVGRRGAKKLTLYRANGRGLRLPPRIGETAVSF